MGSRIRHQPTAYRDLMRRWKSGGKARDLINEAKSLEDPYYRARALFNLSGDGSLSEKVRREALGGAFESADKENREWRKGELLSEFLKDMDIWKEVGKDLRRESVERIMDLIIAMPDGEGLKNTIEGVSRRIECRDLRNLLGRALSNSGFELDGGRSVIREIPRKCGPDVWADIGKRIEDIEDPMIRSKLLGYSVRRMPNTEPVLKKEFLEKASEGALKIGGFGTTEALRYLVDCCGSKDELEILIRSADELDSPSMKCRTYLKIATKKDELKDVKGAKEVFDMVGDLLEEIDDQKDRALVKLNLGKGLEKLGEKKLAKAQIESAIAESTGGGIVKKRIVEKARKMGIQVSEPVGNIEERVEGGRAVLAIYDAYEGGIKAIHRRMIGKAAPLCWSFGLDLALVGFPVRYLDNLIESTVRDTNIGKGGKFINKLRAEGRIKLIQRRRKNHNAQLNKLGMLVATTSHPDRSKAVTMEEAVMRSKEHPTGRVCLIMGLGRRGLPGSLLESVDHHLELTGIGVPLETSTSMGVMAEKLRRAMD